MAKLQPPTGGIEPQFAPVRSDLGLPAQATSSHEEPVRELALSVMVARGLADSDARRVVPDDEMGRRIRQWRR